MEIAKAQDEHFRRRGFFLIANGLDSEEMEQIRVQQRHIEPEWERTEWPQGYNRLACQFLMMGESLMQLAEQEHLVQMVAKLLGCRADQVHIGACGLGDAAKVIAADGRPQRQVHWHADGSPEVAQVSVRTALDRHDDQNGPLRILPGSHLMPREEIGQELLELELATGQHDAIPDIYFVRHPQEVEVYLDPRWSLVWTPSLWHATGAKKGPGRRRAMSWNYFPPGGRKRDAEAVKYLFADQWQKWSPERQRLWGLL